MWLAEHQPWAPNTPVTSPVGPALLDKSMKDSDGGRNDTISHNLINLLFSPLYFPPRLPDVSVPTQLWRQPDPILCFLSGGWRKGASGKHCTFIELVNLHQNRGQTLIPPAGSGQEMGSGQLLTSLETRSLWTRAAIPTPSTEDLERRGMGSVQRLPEAPVRRIGLAGEKVENQVRFLRCLWLLAFSLGAVPTAPKTFSQALPPANKKQKQ